MKSTFRVLFLLEETKKEKMELARFCAELPSMVLNHVSIRKCMFRIQDGM